MKKRSLPTLRTLGFFSRSHGFKGDLILAVEDEDPGSVGRMNYVFVDQEGRPVPFKVEEQRIHRGDLIVHLEGIDSPESARPLLHASVKTEKKRSRAHAAAPGWEDLTGYEAVDSFFGSLGPILEIQEFPMQFLARCMVNGHEVLLPLNETTVKSIDEETEQVEFHLPAGLLDVYLDPNAAEEDAPD